MSLYDEAMAAGAPAVEPLDADLIQRILNSETDPNGGGGYGEAKTYRDPVTGRTFTAQADYGITGTGNSQAQDRSVQGPWRIEENLGNGMGRMFDGSGASLGDYKYDNSWREMIQAMMMVAPAVGGVLGWAGAGAGAGATNGAFLGEGVASGVGGWDQAFINAGGTLEGAAALSSGVNPQSPDVTQQLSPADTGPLPDNPVQQIEITAPRLPNIPTLTPEELAMRGLAGGAAAELGSIPPSSEEVFDPTNYSNEGRNYPTETSTQGPGGSPVNASQFPGTPINDVNGNPVTQPTYDSNGNQVVPPVSNNGGTNPITNTPTSNPFGTGDFKNLFDVLSGLYGLKLANDAAEKSDPFGPYRKGYADKLQALEANPGLLKSTPGFMAGQDSISRQMASKGYLGSGNQAASLQRFSGDFYNNEANRLATLAGANIAPGNTYFSEAQLVGKSLSNIGYGLSPYMGGPR